MGEDTQIQVPCSYAILISDTWWALWDPNFFGLQRKSNTTGSQIASFHHNVAEMQ